MPAHAQDRNVFATIAIKRWHMIGEYEQHARAIMLACSVAHRHTLAAVVSPEMYVQNMKYTSNV